MHPDVAKVVWRYGRWHHYVEYYVFKKRECDLNPEQVAIRRNLGLNDSDNRLKLKAVIDLNSFPKVNEYGMTLKKLSKKNKS
jgi:hypothetical protein